MTILNARPAGLVAKSFDETAGKNLQPDIYYPINRVTSTVQDNKIVHIPDIVHGISTRKSESVARTFQAAQQTPISATINEVREQIYASNRNEPLGRSRIYGYQLPPANHVFGITLGSLSESISETLNPRHIQMVETEEIRAMYRRTHKDYDAGEQRVRGYDLPATITGAKDFRYGKESRRTEGSVEQCLQWAPK